MSIRFAITGAGYIAEIHAQAIQQHEQAQLVAIQARDTEKTTKFMEKFNVSKHYTDLNELFAQESIDALIIATPNFLHVPQAKIAIQAGCHVMIEKPLSMNYQEGLTLSEWATQAKVQLMVAHCWRFDEEVLWLKNQLDQNKVGPIIRSKSYGVHANWGPAGWFSQQELAGGGALADMGIHAIDTTRFLLGDPQPVSVYANIGTYYGDYDVDDTGIIIIQWDNQCCSYIESGWWQPHMDGPEASTQLYGVNGLAEVFPTRMKLSPRGSGEVTEVDAGFPHPRPVQCPQKMYDTQLAHFIQMILDPSMNEDTRKPGLLEGLVNMRIVDAAYQSAKTGQVITLASCV